MANYRYQSLSYVARLEFRDAHGVEAIFHCYQRLRVLTQELACITHRIWGSGDQLQSFVSANSDLAHQFNNGEKDVLVSTLRRPAHAGDEIEIHSTRRIHHAFKAEREFWEYVPYSPTEQARLAISFPIGREVQALSVSTSAGASSPSVTRPATKEIIMRVRDPQIGALYRVEWSW